MEWSPSRDLLSKRRIVTGPCISDLVGSPMVKERELDHLAPTGARAGDGGLVRVGRKGR